MISVRVTYAERKKLMELKAQRGCQNMSQVIRLMLGFPRSVGNEPIEGADDIDGVAKLIAVNLRLIERVDVGNAALASIAKKMGVKELDHRPIALLETPIDISERFPFRNGHQHPALPEGFKRA